MQKEIDNLEFVQGVHFEFINSLKNNGTKYLLLFDDPCAEICNFYKFLDIATVGRHRGFSTIYIKHNLFHKNKLGRDVELQNTHIVLLKSLRDVHQVATLSVQLGLGSTLVDWYQDATSVPFGHLLIDLSPRTDDRLRYCTNSGNISSNFKYMETWSIWKTWTMNTVKFTTLQAFQQFFLACKIQFLKTCPKEYIQFLSECIVNLLQINFSEVKRRHVLKYRDKTQELFDKKQLGSNKEVYFRRKKNYCSQKQIALSSLIIFLEMEHFVLVPFSVSNSSNDPTFVTK